MSKWYVLRDDDDVLCYNASKRPLSRSERERERESILLENEPQRRARSRVEWKKEKGTRDLTTC